MNSDLTREASSPHSSSVILGTGPTPFQPPEGPVEARQVDRLVVLYERVARGRPPHSEGECRGVHAVRSLQRPQHVLDRRGPSAQGADVPQRPEAGAQVRGGLRVEERYELVRQ